MSNINNQEDDLLVQLQQPSLKGKAFGKVVSLYQERIYWHIRKMVLVHDDANDVMQNTFMKAWNALGNFRGDSKLSTWMYKIATNETLTFLANKRLRNLSTIDEAEDVLLRNLKADSYFDANEVDLKFQQALLTLPEKQRLVFNMKYFDELKYDEIEAILGTSVGALKASYHHAVKKIEKYFEEND